MSKEFREKTRLGHLGQTPWNKNISVDCSHLKPHQFKRGQRAWNKGLTKEIYPELRGNPTKGRNVWNKGKKGLQKAWNKGIPQSKEAKEKNRAARVKRVFPLKDTKIEKKLHEILDSINVRYRKHFPIYHQKMGYHQVDIMFVDHEGNPKIAIECDGDYWHGCPEHFPNSKIGTKQRIRDRLIDGCLHELGIKVIRLWEHDINKGKIPIDLYNMAN